MSELDKDQFACIGCGAMNPVGAEVCAGCGHRFAGPEGDLPSKARLVPSPNPRPVVAGISTVRWILLAVVVIGVGMVSFVTLPALGIAVLAVLVAALAAGVWTWIVSIRRSKEGRQIDFEEKRKVFAGTFGGTLIVLISSSIAFAVTCFPLGLVAFNQGGESGNDRMMTIAFGVGGLSALVMGAGLSLVLIRQSRSLAVKKSQDKEQP